MAFHHNLHPHKPICALLLLCTVLGAMVAHTVCPEENAWWSVIYPEFSSAYLQQLPAGQEDQLEIRWHIQELWQGLSSEARPVQDSPRPLSSPACCDLTESLP